MAATKIPGNSKEQEVIVDTNIGFKQGWGNFKYKPEFCQIAYDILSSDGLKTKAHLCAAFHCSKPTIVSWVKKYPDFREAVECGLAAGEKIFRQKCQANAFSPSRDVNNGLIKMLAANVYGIKEEATPAVVVNQVQTKSAEEQMKDRGIPAPDFCIPDLDNMHSSDSAGMDSCESGDTTDPTLAESRPGESSDLAEDPSASAGEEGETILPGRGQSNTTNESGETAKKISSQAMEIIRLKAQIEAQKMANKAAKEVDQNRGVKGFGLDFETSDENIGLSPFGG